MQYIVTGRASFGVNVTADTLEQLTEALSKVEYHIDASEIEIKIKGVTVNEILIVYAHNAVYDTDGNAVKLPPSP